MRFNKCEVSAMRKFWVVFLTCAFLFACSGNRSEVPLKEGEGKHFLWKVSDENSSVWLLGSIHFADSSFYPLDPVIENAFASAEELAVEIDVSNDSVSSEVAKESVDQGLLPSGKRLQDILPLGLWNSLDSICTDWKIPCENFQMFKPWLVAMSLSTIAIQRAGINPSLGVDVVLLDRAATDGKAIVGLETAEEQIGSIADTSDSDSAGIYYLKTTLREISELDSLVGQIVRAWKSGDDALLRKALGEADEEEEKFASESEKEIKNKMEEKVYLNRNEKMAKSIAEFLEEDRNVFVVVGVAHLALEKENVIDKLKRRGLKIERF